MKVTWQPTAISSSYLSPLSVSFIKSSQQCRGDNSPRLKKKGKSEQNDSLSPIKCFLVGIWQKIGVGNSVNRPPFYQRQILIRFCI